MPTLTLEYVAAMVVDAAVAGRRAAVIPRRVHPLHTIRELPSRMNDLLLVGLD
jgi:hypothetical protein